MQQRALFVLYALAMKKRGMQEQSMELFWVLRSPLSASFHGITNSKMHPAQYL